MSTNALFIGIFTRNDHNLRYEKYKNQSCIHKSTWNAFHKKTIPGCQHPLRGGSRPVWSGRPVPRRMTFFYQKSIVLLVTIKKISFRFIQLKMASLVRDSKDQRLHIELIDDKGHCATVYDNLLLFILKVGRFGSICRLDRRIVSRGNRPAGYYKIGYEIHKNLWKWSKTM